jgi:nitrate reductase NapAB chaperone NapD
MPISSLVVTLDPDPELSAQAIAALGCISGATLGERHQLKLPLVLESDSLRQGRDTVEHLPSLPGVLFVDVVQIDFEDADQTPCNDDNSY